MLFQKVFYLRQALTTGESTIIYVYGLSEDTPISWYNKTSEGDRIGLIRGTTVYLSKTFSNVTDIFTDTDNIVCNSSYVKQCSTALLKVASITGLVEATLGTTAAKYTAVVKNYGDVDGTALVTFYSGATILGTIGTGSIAPNFIDLISLTINPSTWAIGTYSICVKTNYEA